MEKEIFPNDLHFKVAFTGCANDCIKTRMRALASSALTEPQYEKRRYYGLSGLCQSLRKNQWMPYRWKIIGLSATLKNALVVANVSSTARPEPGLTQPETYYRLVIMGRTGKRNPGWPKTSWSGQLKMPLSKLSKTPMPVTNYIDQEAPGGKEHIGYIIDRTGFEEYKKMGYGKALSWIPGLSSKARFTEWYSLRLIYFIMFQEKTT